MLWYHPVVGLLECGGWGPWCGLAEGRLLVEVLGVDTHLVTYKQAGEVEFRVPPYMRLPQTFAAIHNYTPLNSRMVCCAK